MTKCARCPNKAAEAATLCEQCLADQRSYRLDRRPEPGTCVCGAEIEPWRNGLRCSRCSRRGSTGVTCSRCHERGHTWQTCSLPPFDEGPIGGNWVREHRPITEEERSARRIELASIHGELSRLRRKADLITFELVEGVVIRDRPAAGWIEGSG